jgi:hypothetical protein
MLGTREIPRYEFVSVLGLLSPLYNKNSDQGRQDEISERVSTIRTLVKERIRDDEMVIKLSDVSEICTRLKNNKACGHDNISYEQIKYGGKPIFNALQIEGFFLRLFIIDHTDF